MTVSVPLSVFSTLNRLHVLPLVFLLYSYPGRPVSAWLHNSYQGYPTDSSWYSPSPQVAPQSQVGFRPYRQQAADDEEVGVGAGASVRRAYQGSVHTSVHASVHASVHGSQWADNPVARLDYEDALLYGVPMGSVPVGSVPLGSDPYYQQQYPALRYGHALRHSRHDEQESGLAPTHLANSMVQLEKSGGTRTELA